MIARLWHGWTAPDHADAYEALLKDQIFPAILARGMAGFQRIELLRRPAGEEVEFITLMWFDSLEAIRAFAGEDYATAVVPPPPAPCSAASTAAPSTTRFGTSAAPPSNAW
jgi:hypothetical protein